VALVMKPSLLNYELRKTLIMTYGMRNDLIHISGPYQSSLHFLAKCSLRVCTINVIVFTRLGMKLSEITMQQAATPSVPNSKLS